MLDHIITNNVTGHNDFKSSIIKIGLSDHFPIVLFALKINTATQKPVVISTYKRSYCEKSIDKSKNRNCDETKKLKTPIKYINTFSIYLFDIYEKSFRKTKVKVKFKKEIFASIAVQFFKLLRRKVLFINRKDNRNC